MGYSSAFSALSSQAVLLLIGMMVVGQALTEVGVVDFIVHKLEKLFDLKERTFLIVMCVAVGLVAAFTNALVVLAAMLPIIDHVCMDESSHMDRKRLYLPICVASYYGCILTSIGASSMLNVSAQLEASPAGRGLTFFEPATIGLAGFLVALVYIATIGYSISKRTFHFEEIKPVAYAPVDPADKNVGHLNHHMKTTIVISVVAILLLLFSDIPYGVTAMTAAMLLVLTKCVTMEVFQKISWSTIFTIVGSIGIGAGFAESGAGELTAEFLMHLAGPLAESPFFICCIMMLITSIMSNFMSNNASVAITCPIAFGLATQFGCELAPFAVACGVGALLSCMTPLCNANIAVAQRVGYPFSKYVIWGLPLNMLSYLACCVSLYFVYFL
jgi:di/tricarboxylate transporter